MIKIHEGGNELCEILQFEVQAGQKQITIIHQVGGKPLKMKGRKQPDIVTFVSPIMPDISRSHELRDEQGNSMRISITSASNSNGVIFVSAIVL